MGSAWDSRDRTTELHSLHIQPLTQCLKRCSDPRLPALGSVSGVEPEPVPLPGTHGRFLDRLTPTTLPQALQYPFELNQ